MTMEQNLLDTLELFKQGKTGKNGKFFAVANALVYRDIRDRHGVFESVQDILVIRTNSGVFLGNSSRLPNLEDRRYKNSINEAAVQRILADHISMVPFSVFHEAGLDILTCEIVDSGPAETLKELGESKWSEELGEYKKQVITRHYTGARLFKASPKKRMLLNAEIPDKYFLCDVDRRETEHKIINFFLAELPEKCGSITEAYEMLKPDEVKTFEKNTGSIVDRQGEFFFIPSSHDEKYFYNDDLGASQIRRIQVGNSRPNTVEKGYEIGGVFYVTGTIEHTGREHAPLKLDTNRWFKVVPNTSKANFQLTGDID